MRITNINLKQRVLLWVGFSVLILLVSHPPYKFWISEDMPSVNLGHRNIIRPLPFESKAERELYEAFTATKGFGIDTVRLVLELGLVCSITLVGILVLRNRGDLDKK